MSRTTAEWQGRTDDSGIPAGVRLRILNRQRNDEGVPICPDCGQPIRPSMAVEYDHSAPLIDGGKHAEGNLRAIHKKPCHANKTALEATSRAAERSQAIAVYGLSAPKPSWAKRGFAKRPKQHTATRELRKE